MEVRQRNEDNYDNERIEFEYIEEEKIEEYVDEEGVTDDCGYAVVEEELVIDDDGEEEEEVIGVEKDVDEDEEYYEEEIVCCSDDDDRGRIEFVDDAAAASAAAVDLNILVVENLGLEVAVGNDSIDQATATTVGRIGRIGRIVRSTRDLTHLPLYSPILRERPAIVCKQQDYIDYIERFLDSSMEVQAGVLDMFYQPLDSPIGRSLIEPAKLLFLLGAMDDFKLIHRLLSIYVTNGHQYRDDQAAITIFGSKFSHSCRPNAAFTSMSEDGCLEYVTIQRSVRKGDEVTFSYLSDLSETPTSERRNALWQTKTFVCMCPRCLGPDYCRCLRCPVCHQLIPCRYKNRQKHRSLSEKLQDNWLPSKDFEPYWECRCCSIGDNDNNNNNNNNVNENEEETTAMSDTTPIILRVEKQVASTLEGVEQQIKSQASSSSTRALPESSSASSSPSSSKNDQITTIQLQELVDDVCETLSSVHHLTIKALRLLVVTSTNQTFQLISQCAAIRPKHRTIIEVALLLRTAVLAGMQIVLAGECVASNCTGCYRRRPQSSSSEKDCISSFNICHDPLYDRATSMRHVVEDLVQLPIFFWPPQALVMVQRYHRVLRVKFRSVLEAQLHKLSECWHDEREDEDETTYSTKTSMILCKPCGIYWTGRLEG